METIFFDRIGELKKEKLKLENQLSVKIFLSGKKAIIQGEPLDEYVASQVLDAMSFGFSARDALILREQDVLFRKINIKDFTRRKDLWDVKARIIGAKGQTKKTIEEISGCKTMLKDNTVGVIGPAESIDAAITALSNLIRGSKQANVYRYLEKQNRFRKEQLTDLGLKPYKKSIRKT